MKTETFTESVRARPGFCSKRIQQEFFEWCDALSSAEAIRDGLTASKVIQEKARTGPTPSGLKHLGTPGKGRIRDASLGGDGESYERTASFQGRTVNPDIDAPIDTHQ